MSNKKKIVIVSLYGAANKGGVERVCYYLNEILSKHYTTIILKEIPVKFWKFDILVQSIVMSFRLCFIKNKIVFSNSWQSFLYPVDFSLQHGTTAGEALRVMESTKSIGAKFISLLEKISCKTAKYTVAVGENAAVELQKFYHVKQEKIKILANFVDEKLFYPLDNRIVDRKNNTFIILFSGRLDKRKGVDVLKKLSDYIETSTSVHLRIACGTEHNANLFKSNKNTKVEMGLTVHEMRDFYNSGDILFFPTYYEGFSMATLEALCCGIPVFGTEYAIPIELRHYEFTQVYDLLDVKLDVNNVLFEMQRLAGNYKNRKTEIHETIKEHFGYKQYKDKLLKLIKTCVADNRTHIG